MRVRLIVLLLLVASAAAEDADVLFRGGTVIDGSGGKRFAADVAIRDDQIIRVGDCTDVEAVWTIDCSGSIICPGFIDLHNHSDRQIVRPQTRAAVNYVTQGCTTLVTGNCGSGPVDTAVYLKKIDVSGAGPNVAHLIPQGSVRERVLGSVDVAATAEQIKEMRALCDRAMQDGAWGMSTGLIYVPSSYADTEELIELASVVGEHGGIYASHIRGEGTGLLKSVNEALEIGRQAEVPVHVSHFKSSGRDAWGLVREAVRMIEAERAAGRTVTADQYPYIASSTSLGATLLPSTARAGGSRALITRMDDPETGPALIRTIERSVQKKDGGRAVRIARYAPNQAYVGKSLAEIATMREKSAAEIAEEILRGGGASIVNFSMDEEDVRHVMAVSWVATASDGRAYLPGADRPHPRNYGTFPRKLAYYSLQQKIIGLEQAVRSMTSLPAEIMGIRDRGLLKAGMMADLVVFNPATLKDRATFDAPHQYAQGIQYVLVNGTMVVTEGIPTGALPGRALRHGSDDGP